MRPRSTWREPFENRGSRDHDALSFEDACFMLAGCTGLAYSAFRLRYSDDQPEPMLMRHLLGIAQRELRDGLTVTPEQLVVMAVHEERTAESRRTDKARYLFVSVTRAYWRHNLARPYARISSEIDQLCSDAWKVARRRLEPV